MWSRNTLNKDPALFVVKPCQASRCSCAWALFWGKSLKGAFLGQSQGAALCLWKETNLATLISSHQAEAQTSGGRVWAGCDRACHLEAAEHKFLAWLDDGEDRSKQILTCGKCDCLEKNAGSGSFEFWLCYEEW